MQSLSYGEIPDKDAIIAACDGRPYRIRGISDAMMHAFNDHPIDAHLEAIFFSEVQGERWNTSGADIEPESMPVLVRRLTELWNDGNEEAGDDASAILATLSFEWI